MHSRLLVAGLLLAAAGSGHSFCFHAYGGVGEYSGECDSSIEMEASASNSSIRRFVIIEKAPTRAFSWLKAATTAFKFKTLLRH